jgi:undecaprenyl-phosphate 4-deoxy-4-formamido-L-arabinose transferase
METLDERLNAPPALRSPVSSISVVVPVYRSAECLPQVAAALAATLPLLTPKYEVVFVNDGSPDDSWKVIERLGQRYPWIRGFSLMRNFGQHNALLCGIRAARYEIIVTMDDDLQHRPEDIRVLLDRLSEGYDVVYGYPEGEAHNVWRGLASRLTKFALRSSMGVEVAHKVSAFRAFRSELRRAFSDFHGPFVSIDVLLSWATTRFSAVDVDHHARCHGDSNYTFRKLLRHALNMITGFSVLPLQVASLVGLVCSAFGGGLLLYVLGRYVVQGTTVPGFPFLASIIAIFSGAQLFALGIIGEYLARMHFRMMDKPTYGVRSTLGND